MAVKHKVDYIADKEYHNDTLEYVHHAYGRAIKHNATWQYEYSIVDHLGNVRATFCDLNGNGIISNNERRSRVDYYTFGMEHYSPYSESQYSVAKNNYKYNDNRAFPIFNWKLSATKALNSEGTVQSFAQIVQIKMGWNNLLYGARNYDACIGRFGTVDAWADKFPSHSPYNYTMNNPIKYIDPTGNGTESTHIDLDGNVIAEYDDGDNGVYAHNNGTTQSQVDEQRQGGKHTGGDGNYIGELGGTLDINEIAKNIFAKNKAEAINLSNAQWVGNVLPGSKWDYKNNMSTIFGVAWADGKKSGNHTEFIAGNLQFNHAADFGNYNAGYTGALAGITQESQYRWAGLGEVAKFNNMGERLGQIISGTVPYGDQVRDFRMNSDGMQRGAEERIQIKNLKWPTPGTQTEKIYRFGFY